MKQNVTIENRVDDDGNPAGGMATSAGMIIDWQNGPLGRGVVRLAPNGAFVEDVLEVCLERLKFYQDSKFKCSENEIAIHHVMKGLEALDRRTKRREAELTEGTHEGT